MASQRHSTTARLVQLLTLFLQQLSLTMATTDANSPPQYNLLSLPSELSTILLNLTPLQNAVSFQLGALGYGSASLEGDVQVSFDFAFG